MKPEIPRFYVDHIERDNGDVTWIVIDRQDEYPTRDYSSVECAQSRLDELQRWTLAETRASGGK